MSYVATLDVIEPMFEFAFSLFNSDLGYIGNAIHPVIREIETPGVDARRFRVERNAFREFSARTMADYSSYDAAVVVAKQYERSIGQPSNLYLMAADYLETSFMVQVIDCVPRVRYGFSGGAVLSDGSSSTALIVADWRFVCTEAA